MRNIAYKIIEQVIKKISRQLAQLHCINVKNHSIDLMKDLQLFRLPSYVSDVLPRGINNNNRFLAGQQICFHTNSENLKIYIVYKKTVSFKHMSIKATSGIDLYGRIDKKTIWYGCISPQNNFQMYAQANIKISSKLNKAVLYLPAFAEVEHIYITVNANRNIYLAKQDNEDKIIVYGSSITQGCAASRPALSYVNILSRKLNKEILNYGFSESARGEEEIINYIAERKGYIYILEYDHNSSVDELRNNHLKIYLKIREANKASLIILLSRMSGSISISVNEEQERLNIIYDTYNYALKKGDKNIVLINGSKIIQEEKDEYFVDDRHPNDAGMIVLADAIYKEIQKREIKYE